MSAWKKVQFALAIFYVLICLSGAVTFFYFKNYPSAVLAFLAGAVYMLTAHLLLQVIKQRLTEWYSVPELQQIGRMGYVFFLAGVGCLVYHTVIQILLKKAIMPISDSSVISIVWSFMLLKSGLVLLYYTRKFQVANEPQLLIEETTEDAPAQENNEIFATD